MIVSLKLPPFECLSYYRTKEKTQLMFGNGSMRRIQIFV